MSVSPAARRLMACAGARAVSIILPKPVHPGSFYRTQYRSRRSRPSAQRRFSVGQFRKSFALPATGAPAAIRSAAPGGPRRTIGAKATAGGFLNRRRILNLSMQPRSAGRLDLGIGSDGRCCKSKNGCGQSDRELVHGFLLRSAVRACSRGVSGPGRMSPTAARMAQERLDRNKGLMSKCDRHFSNWSTV